MPVAPSKVCLQKALKEGLRRCVYRRWEAQIKGPVLITKTTDLERMYRGNTPYPIGRDAVRRRIFADNTAAKASLATAVERRKRAGYSVK
jgi:hypothetical protein